MDAGVFRERTLTIGFDGRFLQDSCHGLGRYAFGLLTGLSTLEGNHKIIIFIDPTLPNTIFALDRLLACHLIEVRCISIPLHDPRELLAWPGTLRQNPVDLFHTPYFLSPAVLPCPVVATVHDMIYDHFPQFLPASKNPIVQPTARLAYRLTSRAALRRARRIIAVSESTRRDIAQVSHIDLEKIVTIPPGVDASFRPVESPQERDRIRTRYGLFEPYVLAVHGTRRPHKNLGRLVAAFRRIQFKIPHMLVFVGSSDRYFRDTAAGPIADLKRDGRLIEVAHVDEPDLSGVYTMADLLVQPSIFEGFGLPVLEAMACGCPVACSSTGGLPEVGGNAATYFCPESEEAMAETMLRVLSSAEQRRAMCKRGLHRASGFTWEQAAVQTLAVYRGVMVS